MKSFAFIALLLGVIGACTPADPRPSSRLDTSTPVSPAVRQTWAAASCRAVDCGGMGPDQQSCVAVARSGDEGGFFYRVFFQIEGGKLVLPSVVCDSAG